MYLFTSNQLKIFSEEGLFSMIDLCLLVLFIEHICNRSKVRLHCDSSHISSRDEFGLSILWLSNWDKRNKDVLIYLRARMDYVQASLK